MLYGQRVNLKTTIEKDLKLNFKNYYYLTLFFFIGGDNSEETDNFSRHNKNVAEFHCCTIDGLRYRRTDLKDRNIPLQFYVNLSQGSKN